MRRGVVGLHEELVHLLELRGRLGQRKLIVKQAPLDIKMRLHQIFVAFPLGTDNSLVVNRQTRTDRSKSAGAVGPAAIRDQVLRRPIAQTGAYRTVSATQLASLATAPASMVRE